MRHPYASMDQYLLDWTQLWHIGTIYNIKQMLQLKAPDKEPDGSSFYGCGFLYTVPNVIY